MPWQVYQPNPDNLTTGDCVIRAVCAVTGLDWRVVHRVLCALSEEMADIPSSNRVWWTLLRGIGFSRVQLIDTCPNCYTVRDFAKDHPAGRFILGPMEHAVAVIDGNYWDSWDSGGTVPIYYFEEVKTDVGQSLSGDIPAVSGADANADGSDATGGADKGDRGRTD